MLNNPKSLRSYVNAPSVGAMAYQAYALSIELEAIKSPKEARQVRDVLLTIVDYVQTELQKIFDFEKPYAEEHDPGFIRTRQLARVLHEIYFDVLCLRANTVERCPPAIQTSVSSLVEKYFPESNSKPVCLVRAQPAYMADYKEPITDLFENLITPDLLDPSGDLITIDENYEVLQTIWRQYVGKLSEPKRSEFGSTPPRHVAIISFAGLDGYDTLLYPILAHEIAHFIDLSYHPHLHMSENIVRHIKTVLKKAPYLGEEEGSRLKSHISVCLRELMADLLAVRMMGFSFFLAQAEFLKTLTGWHPSILITPTGYPENHLRLGLVFGQLLAPSSKGNVRNFLKGEENTHSKEAGLLQVLLNEWEEKLLSMNKIQSLEELHKIKPPSDTPRSPKIVAECVIPCIPELIKLAAEIIPDEKCSKLQPSLFDRVALLKDRKSPLLVGDSVSSFSEIMTAAWAYQILYGEEREMGMQIPEKMFREYDTTCKLTLGALNAATSQNSNE